MAHFTVYFKTGWRWMLVANNNETIATSEPYSSEDAAIRGAQTVQRLAPGAPIRR